MINKKNTDRGSAPLVSIGMPVFNGEKHLRQALDSLLDQTFSHFDLTIIDNASTDDTKAICLEYQERDSRVRYMRHMRNIGIIDNFQSALAAARGRYFMWAAADDWWSRNWIEELLGVIDNDVAIAFGSTVRTKVDLRFDGAIKLYNIDSPWQTIRLLDYFLRDENGKGNPFYGLMRTDFVREQGIYPADHISYGRDYLHIFNLLRHGSIKSSPKAILLKRNTVSAVRRNRYPKALLPLLFACEFTQVTNLDRLRYLKEFIHIAPRGYQKTIIGILLPAKLMQGLTYQYLRSGKRGIKAVAGRTKL